LVCLFVTPDQSTRLLYVDKLDFNYPVPDSFIAEGNKRMAKLLEFVGLEKPDDHSKSMMHLIASYFIVKSTMPLRIFVSLGLTPSLSKLLFRLQSSFQFLNRSR
jgi:hypothetical protein